MEQLHNLVEDAMQESGSYFESGKIEKSSLSQSKMEQLHNLVEDAMLESGSNSSSGKKSSPNQWCATLVEGALHLRCYSF